jgi:hypothetical protein
MTLTLRTMPHPAESQRDVRIFADWQRACDHLRDHLLTAPECHAWALVAPAYRDLLDPADGDARWRYDHAAQASSGAAAQPLYDLYAAAIVRAAGDAARLHWVFTCERVTVALGTCGLLLVVGEAVQTAFLPGQGDAARTAAAGATTDPAGLPREGGMRSGRPGRYDPAEPERERRARAERERQMSPDQLLYYRVFRPAAQFVRKCHHRQRDLRGRLLPGDYALLKEVLPPQSRLKFADWQALRRPCGHG